MTRVRESGANRLAKKPRTRPLRGEDVDVKHVVEIRAVSDGQARELIRRHGNDSRKIDEAAKSYKDEN